MTGGRHIAPDRRRGAAVATLLTLGVGLGMGVAGCTSGGATPRRSTGPVISAPSTTASGRPSTSPTAPPSTSPTAPPTTSPTAPPTTAASTAGPRAGSAWLTHAIEDVAGGAPAFGLRDSTGVPMDTLKVIDAPGGGYLGVYHTLTPGGFVVRLARSTDLRVWTYSAQLDTHASQPALLGLSDGGYLLADEADNDGQPGPGRRWVRFRHYAGLAALLAARPDRTLDTPHTLTRTDRGAEGTPNIYSASLDPDLDHSTIRVGLHYLAGDVDRQARGVLTDFRSWTTQRAPGFDQALADTGMHGKHGDRDAVDIGGALRTVVEVQSGSNDIWHIELFNAAAGTADRLKIITPGGSTSFANPTVTIVTLPDGRKGLVVTLFLPTTGAAPGEAGELLYSHALPPGTSTGSAQLASPPR